MATLSQADQQRLLITMSEASKIFKTLNDRFGQDLFGTFRKTGEPDTDEEAAIFKLLRDFVIHEFGPRLNPKFVKALNTLQKEKSLGKYLDVLKHDGGPLYRGMDYRKSGELLIGVEEVLTVSSAEDVQRIKTVTKKPTFRAEKKGWYLVGRKIQYRPHVKTQSWSANKAPAAFRASLLNNWPVIIEANLPSKERLFRPDFLNKINRSLGSTTMEFEVIRMGGPVTVDAVYMTADCIAAALQGSMSSDPDLISHLGKSK